MLDRLTYGDAERLTADAPVPVLAVRSREERAGGAANVCQDLVALGMDVTLVSVVGEDAEGARLIELLEEGGVDVSGVVRDGARPTTIKESLIGLAQHRHPQKMFRLDTESKDSVDSGVEGEVLARFAAALEGAAVVAIEDYNKGLCTAAVCGGVIARAREAGMAVLVDSASGRGYRKYRGC